MARTNRKSEMIGPSGLHIGLLIETRIVELRMSKREFAIKLGVSDLQLPRILRCSSIDTNQLALISDILNYDFFAEFSKLRPHLAPSAEEATAKEFAVDPNECIQLLKDQVQQLTAALADKDKIIALLEGAKKDN